MTILCVIPVRGGSKGVPRKNARMLAGKPLVLWTIEQALAAHPRMDVIVSTDDEELAQIARNAGAEVPFMRPPELATDQIATEPVVVHAIKHRIAEGKPPHAVMLLQATSPVRLPGTLERAIAQFKSSGVDSLVGVVPQTPFLWRAGTETTSPTPSYLVDSRPRRQDLSASDYFYRETGSLYLSRPELYLEKNNRIGGKVGLFVMDDVEGNDIDHEHDFVATELLLSLLIADKLLPE